MKHIVLLVLIIVTGHVQAQIDSSLLITPLTDTLPVYLNMDAVYQRPFLNIGKLPVSVGGYAEANWQHIRTDGISDGHQFQMRRMTLFVASTIHKKIKFLSETEFEAGGKEIAIEFASVDVEFYPLLNLRGGIIMNPIGAFNQNHDGPKWEFTDRPISATQLLPATWSNGGFGLFGKSYKNDWMFGYEFYLSGGFDQSIVDNLESKTFLPAAKNQAERFEESFSGTPLTTAKVALRNDRWGEVGLSYMGGIYNSFKIEGLILDHKRRLMVLAVDYHNTLPKIRTIITGEWAWIKVDVPETYTQQYGNKQYGGFLDVVQPIFQGTILGWENSTINLACRVEFADWNVGKFKENGAPIGESLWSIIPAISFRPSAQTVLRFNYRIQRQKDIFNNPPAITGGSSLGVSTYF